VGVPVILSERLAHAARDLREANPGQRRQSPPSAVRKSRSSVASRLR
jgi:hypothetical protein